MFYDDYYTLAIMGLLEEFVLISCFLRKYH